MVWSPSAVGHADRPLAIARCASVSPIIWWMSSRRAIVRRDVGQTIPQRCGVLAKPGELLQVGGGKGLHTRPPIGGEVEAHDAVVVGIGHPREQACRLGSVHELDGAVLPQQQVLCDITDRGWLAVAAHDQK